MGKLKMMNRTIISWICMAVIIVFAVLIFHAMIQYNPNNMSDLWDIGNAWMRLFGCLLGILLFAMLIGLFMTIYRCSNSKVKHFFAGLIIGDVSAILIVLAIICSGAAKLDSDFTPVHEQNYVDIGSGYEREEPVVDADEYVAFQHFSTSYYPNYMYAFLQLYNDKDVIIESDCLTYSLRFTDGTIYSGCVDIEAEADDDFSKEGFHSIGFNIYFPENFYRERTYTMEIFFRYFDESGTLHELCVNDKI